MRQIRDDPKGAHLDDSDRAILDFITKLTFNQQHMQAADLDLLRRQGFSEVQILEITTLAAFFNFITRVADGLGVQSNPERKAWEAFLFHE